MVKILVVDDSQTMRDMMSVILTKLDHDIVLAEDGFDAINQTRENLDIQAAFVDVNMPNMGGISLISKIRRIPELSKIPILMVTTETSDYKKGKAQSAGATGWITKPISEERIQKAISKIIN